MKVKQKKSSSLAVEMGLSIQEKIVKTVRKMSKLVLLSVVMRSLKRQKLVQTVLKMFLFAKQLLAEMGRLIQENSVIMETRMETMENVVYFVASSIPNYLLVGMELSIQEKIVVIVL